jgi:hypothetical protein
LYRYLAEIPCRKIVFVDACHSGQAYRLVNRLLPGGQGPTIFAACDPTQRAWGQNVKGGHGLFTRAMMDAMTTKFAEADANHDGRLDVDELAQFVESRMETLTAMYMVPVPQTPAIYRPLQDAPALFRKPDGD